MDTSTGSPTRATDADLRSRLLRGDGAALATAYDIHAGAVFSIARRITGNATRAEDVTQEVFVHLWERPESFDPRRGGLRTYLAMMAHRRAVDLVRSQVARSAREQHFGGKKSSAQASTEDQALAALDSEWAKDSLRLLPIEQRECVELAYLVGLTFQEVARHLGIPEGTAKSRIRLGLKRLQTAFRSQDSAIAPARLGGAM